VKRKVLMLLLIAVFMIAFSYAQSITVTNPHSGSTWHKGSTYTIGWTKSGSMDNNVKITLYKPDHTTLQMIIVRPTANDGSFSWTIPNSIPNGQYIVRVKTIDNQVYDDSVVFNIATPAPTGGTITVTDPHSGDCLEKGSSHTIRWTKSGSMDNNVKITLYKPDHTTLQMIIVRPTVNDGSFSWTIPNSIPDGQYIIRVKTMNNKVYDDSAVFTIKRSSLTDFIKDNYNQPETATLKTYNNTLAEPLQKFMEYKPDLKIIKVETEPSTLYSNRPFSIKVTIKNIGNDIPADKFFKTYAYNNDNSISKGFVKYGLKRNEQIVIRLNNIKYTKAGYYTLQVMVDSSRLIDEANEDNNKALLNLKVKRGDINIKSKLFFKDTKNKTVWVNCGQIPPLIYYNFVDAVRGKIYDTKTKKNWVTYDSKKDSSIGSFQIHDKYRDITIEMESIGKDNNSYSILWVKRKPYIKSFKIVDQTKKVETGVTYHNEGTVAFLYDFVGAEEAYIKYYREKTKTWERLKEIPINKKMMNSTCYYPYSNKYVVKVKRAPCGKLIKYALVIKDKNHVISSKAIKAHNVEGTYITVFDFIE